MFALKPLLWIAIIGFAVLAAPRYETNADRFARGLPPLAPRRRYDPTATHHLKARISGVPNVPVVMQMARTDGTFVGYLAQGTADNYYIGTTLLASADTFQIPQAASTSKDILLTGSSSQPYLSTEKYGTAAIGTGANYGYFLRSQYQDSGNPASYVALGSATTAHQETSNWGTPAGIYGTASYIYTDSDGTTSTPNFYYNVNKKTRIYVSTAASHINNSPPTAWAETDRVIITYVPIS